MLNKLFKSTAVVSFFTFLSRISGLVRDILIANIFGSKDAADAFFIAFKIPNFFRALFAEGAFTHAFVPLLAENKKSGHSDLIDYIANIAGVISLILLAMIAVLIIFPDLLVYILANGFVSNTEKYDLTVQLFQITIGYLFFISLAALFASVLHAHDQFVLPAASPILLNLSFIGFAYNAFYFTPPIMALAVACIVGGVVQLLMQLWGVYRLGLLPKPVFHFRNQRIKEFFKLMVPGIYGVSIMQINTIVDTLIATYLVAGSVSWYYYANRLVALPVGVFGIAIATIVLAKLSMLRAHDQQAEFKKTFAYGVKFISVIGLPATFALVIIAKPLIDTIYRHGAITAFDVAMIQYCLIALTIGLMGFMLLKVLTAVFYSHKDIKTPVRIATYCVVINIALNLAFAIPMHIYWQIGHVGLAIASSLSVLINCLLLLRTILKRNWYRCNIKRLVSFYLRIGFNVAVMSVVLLFFVEMVGDLTDFTILQRILALAIMVVAGFISYAGLSYCNLWRPKLLN